MKQQSHKQPPSNLCVSHNRCSRNDLNKKENSIYGYITKAIHQRKAPQIQDLKAILKISIIATKKTNNPIKCKITRIVFVFFRLSLRIILLRKTIKILKNGYNKSSKIEKPTPSSPMNLYAGDKIVISIHTIEIIKQNPVAIFDK